MSFNSVNVILLYGRQVCARFEQLLTYWDSVIPSTQWHKFLFVIMDERPVQLSAALTEKLASNCVQLDAAVADHVDASQIIDLVMQRMSLTPSVMLQCICSADTDNAIALSAPIELIMRLKEHFATGNFTYLLYMLLTHAPALRSVQTAHVQQMEQTQPDAAYLATTVNQNGASVSMDSVCHTVCCEALVNASGMRQRLHKLSALGYSTLNADNRELERLHEHYISEKLMHAAQQNISPEEAWTLITGEKLSQWTEGALRAPLNHWLDRLMLGDELRLQIPTEGERQTARILACAYQRTPAELKQAVERFFALNTGTPEQKCRQTAGYAQQQERAVRKRLSVRPNAGAFPLYVIDVICDELAAISEETPARPPIRLPENTLMMKLQRHKYINKCCSAFENACEQALHQECRRELAGALSRELKKLGDFIRSAAQLATAAAQEKLSPGEVGTLSVKYPNYDKALEEAFRTQTMAVEKLIAQQPSALFDQDGTPRMEMLDKLRREIAKAVDSALAQPFRSHFCEALALECATEGTLAAFFDKYLVSGARMFHYIHDMPGVPDSVYLADNAFADNPWVLNKTGVMIANNDNIERIDVYPLDAKLTEYLQDAHSSYFAQEAHVTSAANGWKMIGGQLPVQSSVQSVRQAEQEAEAPQEEQKNPMHISIGRNSEGRYVLTWDWKPGAAAATITLYGGGQRLFSRVVTNAEYSMSVGSSPQGVDVTTALSGVGFVQVSVFYNGAPYAQAEVVGRQNRVVYSTDRDRSGKMVLTVEGAPGDICRTVVQCETEGRTLLYPLYALDDLQRYEGLSLPGNFRLIASPMEKYPYVFAVQK